MAYIGRSGWNTLRVGGAIPDDEILEAVDASYALVVARLPKQHRPEGWDAQDEGAGMVREVQVTFDCADPGALAEFWAAALGYRLQPPPPGFDTGTPRSTAWGVPEERPQRAVGRRRPRPARARGCSSSGCPRARRAKNRVHLDVRAAAGARRRRPDGGARGGRTELVASGRARGCAGSSRDRAPSGHIVMLDPEGNEFCLD